MCIRDSDIRGEAPEEELATAIHSMIDRYRASTDVEFTVVTSPAWPDLIPGFVELNLLRVVQEAVNNAVRHGRARRIVLEFEADSTHLVASVSDDGHGIPAGTPPGTGMLGMRERAALLGGRLEVRHRHPGTEVRVDAPLQ